MQVANIHQAKTNLSELIRRAIAGEDVFIARANEPLVRLEPVSRDTRPRSGGQWRNKLWIAPDFDAPDPELESMFYDSLLPEKTEPKK